MNLAVSVDVKQNIDPCLRIGHSLSLIGQPTSEDIKLYIILRIDRPKSRSALCIAFDYYVLWYDHVGLFVIGVVERL